MSISNNDILEALSQKTVLEVVELINMMEEKFGVSASAAVAVAPAADAGAAAAEEKTEFDVKMTDLGANKVSVIKAIRAITGLGLKEAKELAEKSTPVVIKEAMPKDKAEEIAKQLTEAGAKAEVA